MSHPLIKGYGYGECRLIRHSWHIVPSDWTPEFGVPMTLRCERCNTERRMAFNRNTGGIETSRYIYPTGYNFHRNGMEVPTSTDFRLAWLEDQVTNMRKQRADRAAQQKERIGR